MTLSEIMKRDPKSIFEELPWDEIEALFEPTDAFELLLRRNISSVLKELKTSGMPDSGAIRDQIIASIGKEDFYQYLIEEKNNREKRKSNTIRITMKDPDGVYDSLEQAGYDIGDLSESVENLLKKYLEFGEYITVEFDLVKGTVSVVEI